MSEDFFILGLWAEKSFVEFLFFATQLLAADFEAPVLAPCT